MSSLIYYTEKDQAFVATDTLATSPDGEPFMFTIKAFAIPHLRMIICGTGAGGFLGRWFIQVNDRMVIRDIDHLDFHASIVLNDLWGKYKDEFSIPDYCTTTVYHFGFSEEGGLIHAYAYRSTDSFNSEPIPIGSVGVKPECNVSDNFEFPSDIKKMMEEQREIQSIKPKTERVFIGGKIQIHHLTNEGTSIYTMGKFDNHLDDERAIYANYDRRN